MIRTVQHQVADGGAIAEVILNRPEKRNALTPEMAERLAEVIEWYGEGAGERGASDRGASEGRAGKGGAGVSALVLRGEGDVFCSGFDLKLCHADAENLRRLLVALSRCIVAMRNVPGVVVCAIHGAAIAGGCALLGGADVVVAAASTKLGYPVVKLGISAGVSVPFVMRSVGSGAARALTLDPGLIDGERALALGLVHVLVASDGSVAARAMEIAKATATKPVTGIRATKNLLNQLDCSGSDESDGRVGGPGLCNLDTVQRALRVSLGLVGDVESRRRLAAMWGG